MAMEGLLPMTVASVVEDVLNQNGMRLSLDRDLVSRREEEAASRRYEAAAWLRRMVGVVAARDLPEEPSEEEFCLGLRSGIILCNALNKLNPGTIPKVVETPSDFTPPPDGAALCAYQYFENLRNFLVALEDLHLPTFEASDLEKGGKAARVVNCILALKSHSERRGKSHWTRSNSSFSSLNNGNGTSTCSSSSSTKYFVRKNSEPFMNSLFRSQSSEALSVEQNLSLDVSIESSQMTASHSLHMLVNTMLSGKKPEEVPELVGSIISKVVEEFEKRMPTQNEMVAKTMPEPQTSVQQSNAQLSASSNEPKVEKTMDESQFSIKPSNGPFSASSNEAKIKEVEKICKETNNGNKASKEKQVGLKTLTFDRQEKKIQELRQMLCAVKSGMENMRLQYHDEFINLGKHLGKLSHAASGYHKVLEENRKLYNIVQDLKGNIRVYCRVRPLKGNIPTPVASIEDGQITILTPSKYGKEGRKSFKFNKVFGPSATQEEVFSDMQPLIRSVLDGYNVCIFAYGQTGSGKTHTMTGPRVLTEETLGVNYRALNDLFYMSETRKDTFAYEISVQMIEIYNEQVRDLLAINGGNNKRLEIKSSSQKGGLAVPDANIVPVYSTPDVIELMNLGHKNRAVGSTAINDRSSRSHSCLTVHVQGRDLTSGTVLRGSMHLVDLAGSERVNKSEAKGECLKEATHINKSLSALGDVIASLAQKNSHVPYRNSKLTQLLQDSLGGQAKTLMFVHIAPEFDAIGETLGTLKFAERVATVELGAARTNKDNTEVKDLREQLANLKAQLAMKDAGEGDLMRSPEIYRTKSCAALSAHPTIRQPMEEVGNIEVRSNLPTAQKKLNLDASETASETDSASWIDKTIIENSNNENINTSDCTSLSLSVNDSGLTLMSPLPNSFYQRYASDVSITVTRSETGGSDDSDELELGTSYCSSEHDMLMTWNSDLPKVSGLKKPQVKIATSPDVRSASRAHKPSPSRKIPNASSLTPGKVGNGKRTVARKIGNGK